MTSTDEKELATQVKETAKIRDESTGSDRYQSNHQSQIFDQGFSFSGFERNRVFLGGAKMRYLDLSDVSGADTDADCRATVVADFDDDGDPDLFTNAIQRETHFLFRNDVGNRSGNGFVKIRLSGDLPQHHAVGAIVKLRVGDRVQAQLLSCGTGFESQNDNELIFGLGKAEQATVTVRWPGRAEENFGAVAAGGRYQLVEGSGRATPIEARPFQFGTPPPPGMKVRVGDSLTQLAVETLDGKSETLDVRGTKPVLLNFWSTTCASCIAELGDLDKINRAGEYQVICLNLDPASRNSVSKRLWESKGGSLPVYRMDAREAVKYFDLDRLAIPVSLWLSADGEIERLHQGQLPEG